ncbi:uncharacterized protein TNCV_2940211 [Trichonephila clavipes]|nr:uncharacterized protein TNCV_2940211 [Trichonephila clavipes]
MSRFGGLSEERPSVFKTRSKLGTHLSTQCSGDERQVDLAQPVNRTSDLWCGSTIHFHSILFATRGLLATDQVILNHGQVTWTTPELAPPLLTTPPHQREDVLALDRFNVHRCPTRRVFSGTGLELLTKQATFRYLYHSATAVEIY